MRIVVAGGRGFIGSKIVAGLGGAGHDCVAAGPGEVSDQLGATATDALVWAAGHRAADPALMRDQHLDAPLAALAAAPGLARMVYLSTGELYGDAAVPFRESAELAPTHPYAVAKAEGERALKDAAGARGIALVVLRLALVYGPGQRPPMLVPTLIERLRAGESVPLTPGHQTRDFVYVDDVVRAVELALAPSAPPGIYNIGSGIESSVRDVAAEVVDALGADPALLCWGQQPYREAEQMRYVFEVSRARAALGFVPSTSLREGIRRTVGAR